MLPSIGLGILTVAASFVVAPVSLYAYGYYRAFSRQSKTYEGRFVKFRQIDNPVGKWKMHKVDCGPVSLTFKYYQ